MKISSSVGLTSHYSKWSCFQLMLKITKQTKKWSGYHKNITPCVSLTQITPPKSILLYSRFQKLNSFSWNLWSKLWFTLKMLFPCWLHAVWTDTHLKQSEYMKWSQGYLFQQLMRNIHPLSKAKHLAYIFSQSQIKLQSQIHSFGNHSTAEFNNYQWFQNTEYI